jgi:two-component system, sensor histidine kinase and response regulator
MTGYHDPHLVALSIGVATLASYTALDLAERVTAAHGRSRLAWLAAGAVAMGIGIWSMHFVAMLAFHLPLPIAYHIPLVLLSMLAAIAASALALFIVSRRSLSAGSLGLAGISMGGAADLHYRTSLVAASVAIAVTASMAALWLAFHLRDDDTRRGRRRRAGASVVMGLAIAGMHYTAMAAAWFTPVAHRHPADDDSVLATGGLAAAVALAALLILGFALVCAMIDRIVTGQRRTQEAERAAREAAEAASRAKSEFLANMSHEIRTPMHGVMGMLDLALDTDLTVEQHEYLEVAKNSADALLVIINDILDFSKIEAGMLDLDPVPFQLGESLADMTSALAHRAHQKGLELALEIRPDVPDNLTGDIGRFRQVVLNLLGNAIKFTERGEVIVRIAVEALDADEVTVHVAVSDTGIGIPPDKQGAIFEAFTQADSSITRQHGGTGLGLAISSRLVALMGGQIWLESEVSKGSTFHFTARLGRSVAAAMPEPAADSAELRGLRVLIVDDNATNRRVLERVVTGWEMRPCTTEGGEPALVALELAAATGDPYGLVLLDAQMPGMDGFTLAERIVQHDEFAPATIMMLTSVGQRGDAARCRAIGIAAYLTKPIRRADLLNAIRLALGSPGGKRTGAPVITRHSLPSDSPPADQEVRRRMRVLVAEDNRVNQQLAVRLLEKRGHTVVLAGNGRAAVAAFEREPFDVILMDVQMPEMGGVEATAAIRARENGGGRIPIIAMTAHAMSGDREACLAAGMDGYVAKPISKQPLLDQIEALTPSRGSPPVPRMLELSTLLARFEGDRELMGELATIFLEDYPARLAAVQSAVEQRDAVALQGAAHALKGSAGNFGAQAAVEAALRLETMGRQGELTEIESAFAELERTMTQFTGELAALLPAVSG